MPTTVKINKILEGIEMQFDQASSYLNLDTGEVITVEHRFLSRARMADGQDTVLLDWEQKILGLARQIVSSDRWVPLPAKFDYERQLMRDYAESLRPGREQDELLFALRGAGAAQRFKESLKRHRLEMPWSTFRDDALKQIAIDWCNEHKVHCE